MIENQKLGKKRFSKVMNFSAGHEFEEKHPTRHGSFSRSPFFAGKNCEL
jgi:hypothetical protein